MNVIMFTETWRDYASMLNKNVFIIINIVSYQLYFWTIKRNRNKSILVTVKKTFNIIS